MNTSNNKRDIGLVRVYLTKCTSTQDVLANYLTKIIPTHGLYVFTDNQTAGKGQHGRQWVSQPGQNIAMSCYVSLALPVQYKFILQMWTSLAIYNTIASLIPQETLYIKWPNDLIVRNLKIGGILVQTGIVGKQITYAMLGIGLNINQSLQGTNLSAISLFDIAGKRFDRQLIREQIHTNVLQFIERGISPPLIDPIRHQYLSHLWGMKQRVKFWENKSEKSAIIEGVSEEGHLQIRQDGKLREIHSAQLRFDLSSITYE